jgi:hypothetical protein
LTRRDDPAPCCPSTFRRAAGSEGCFDGALRDFRPHRFVLKEEGPGVVRERNTCRVFDT